MKTARIYVFGDSITYGAWDTQGGWCDRIKHKLHELKTDPSYDIKFQVFNLGIGGENSRSLSNRFEAELNNRHRTDWPAVILIATGANDTRCTETADKPAISIEEFQSNLVNIIQTAKKYTDKIILVGIAPVENDRQPFKKSFMSNKLLKKYDHRITSIAHDHSLPKVTVWNAFKSSSNHVYSADGVHPNDNGHAIVMNLVWTELSKYIFESQ